MAETAKNSGGLAAQEAKRWEALQTLQRLRKEARQEISRLINFLDRSDEYVMTDLEDEGDLEEVGDTEPSLGSFDRMKNLMSKDSTDAPPQLSTRSRHHRADACR